MDDKPVIIIDTREQLPYKLPNAVRATLKTGDYSIEGFEDAITIERKSRADLYQSLGQGRKRFEREFKRMSKFQYAAVVVESSLPSLLCPPPYSKMSPSSVVNSLTAWSIRYNVPVWFAGDRLHAAALTLSLLRKFWKDQAEKLN